MRSLSLLNSYDSLMKHQIIPGAEAKGCQVFAGLDGTCIGAETLDVEWRFKVIKGRSKWRESSGYFVKFYAHKKACHKDGAPAREGGGPSPEKGASRASQCAHYSDGH